MTDKPPKRTIFDFTLRGLEELDRFPTPEARARAVGELGAEIRGWELVKGIAISATGAIAVVLLVRLVVPRLLPGMFSRFILQDVSLLLGIVAFVIVVRWLHRRGTARALRPKLIEAGVPVCVGCGYMLRGLPSSTALCPECGTEITGDARRLLGKASANGIS